MNRRVIVKTVTIFSILLLLAACGDESPEELRSIEEIHAAEGVPVEIRELSTSEFSSSYTYTSSLSGAEESSASAMIAVVCSARPSGLEISR